MGLFSHWQLLFGSFWLVEPDAAPLRRKLSPLVELLPVVEPLPGDLRTNGGDLCADGNDLRGHVADRFLEHTKKLYGGVDFGTSLGYALGGNAKRDA